jgi:hypothetical protein
MANTLDAVFPRLLAQGLLALRGATVLPRIVNGDYSNMAAERGKNIDVPVPAAVTAQAVAPANTPPVTADIQPSYVQVPLTQWYEAPFYMTDQDIMNVMNGTLPMQVSEAVKSLAQQVNADIFGTYKDFYGFVGTPGTTPFSTAAAYSAQDTKPATDVRKILNKQLAPMNDRRFVLNPDAEAAALNLRAFQDQSWRGQGPALAEGQLARTLGFDWFMDQQVPTHAAGTQTGTVTVNGANGVGVGSTDGGLTGTLSVATAAASSTAWVWGDIITLAGDTQTYVVLAPGLTLGASATGSANIAPALKVAQAGGAAITLAAPHVVNLAFQRGAIAFASRPLADNTDGLGNRIMSQVDPISGLALRLEISREHKRTRWSFDVLYGMKVIRRQLGCRLAG